jgi:hypothetical protein
VGVATPIEALLLPLLQVESLEEKTISEEGSDSVEIL